jgi:hypothetical protein
MNFFNSLFGGGIDNKDVQVDLSLFPCCSQSRLFAFLLFEDLPFRQSA